jgi:hypothetical protein
MSSAGFAEGSWSLTVLWVDFACDALMPMIRAPLRPSRPSAISMPNALSDVWARRNRPASARGDFGQPGPPCPASITPLNCGPAIVLMARMKVPAGQNAVSQAVAQSAKSAMRGSWFRRVFHRVKVLSFRRLFFKRVAI